MGSFAKDRRLLKKPQFDAVMSRGVKVVCRDFVLIASQSIEDQRPSRLGLVVSRKVGSAVVRNCVKRSVREVFRAQSYTELMGRDLVVIARPALGAQQDFGSAEIKPSFAKCLDRMRQNLARQMA